MLGQDYLIEAQALGERLAKQAAWERRRDLDRHAIREINRFYRNLDGDLGRRAIALLTQRRAAGTLTLTSAAQYDRALDELCHELGGG